MSEQIKEICNILNQIASDSAFAFKLTNGVETRCKNLSTLQLREFIKTIADSPLTQVLFNSTANKIFKESIVNLPENYHPTIYDRLLFLLETRIQSIDSSVVLTNSDGENTNVNLNEIVTSLRKVFVDNEDVFKNKTITEHKISLTLQTPTLSTDERLNEEIYKEYNTNIDGETELKQLIADFFVYELAKYVSSITVESQQTIEFETLTFEDRIEIIQTLPVSLIQHVIDYVEKQKTLVDNLFFIENMYLTIDSSFFALY